MFQWKATLPRVYGLNECNKIEKRTKCWLDRELRIILEKLFEEVTMLKLLCMKFSKQFKISKNNKDKETQQDTYKSYYRFLEVFILIRTEEIKKNPKIYLLVD